jgi:hypothetical protein
MNKCWTNTQIPIFKLQYILRVPKLLGICNLLLMIILLMALAMKKMKISFCNIVVKHSMLNKFGLQGYDAGSLGERFHCLRGAFCVGLWGKKVQDECHLKSQNSSPSNTMLHPTRLSDHKQHPQNVRSHV